MDYVHEYMTEDWLAESVHMVTAAEKFDTVSLSG